MGWNLRQRRVCGRCGHLVQAVCAQYVPAGYFDEQSTKIWEQGQFSMLNIPRRGAHRKQVLVAAYCSILAAYRSKRQCIVFFIENGFIWTENFLLRHFITEKDHNFPRYPKKPLLLHTAAYLLHTGQNAADWFFSRAHATK